MVQFVFQDVRERVMGKAMAVKEPEEAKAAARKELSEVILPEKVSPEMHVDAFV